MKFHSFTLEETISMEPKILWKYLKDTDSLMQVFADDPSRKFFVRVLGQNGGAGAQYVRTAREVNYLDGQDIGAIKYRYIIEQMSVVEKKIRLYYTSGGREIPNVQSELIIQIKEDNDCIEQSILTLEYTRKSRSWCFWIAFAACVILVMIFLSGLFIAQVEGGDEMIENKYLMDKPWFVFTIGYGCFLAVQYAKDYKKHKEVMEKCKLLYDSPNEEVTV
eukprot:snap_masked-scaffold_1-processed-gene-8.40-mRNA-1 protein AED:1.00 eAED:1.00 QI:0/0/0/0/1/1/2/0/219